jgi:hypothetical protein
MRGPCRCHPPLQMADGPRWDERYGMYTPKPGMPATFLIFPRAITKYALSPRIASPSRCISQPHRGCDVDAFTRDLPIQGLVIPLLRQTARVMALFTPRNSPIVPSLVLRGQRRHRRWRHRLTQIVLLRELGHAATDLWRRGIVSDRPPTKLLRGLGGMMAFDLRRSSSRGCCESFHDGSAHSSG